MADFIILHCCDFDNDGHQGLLDELKKELINNKYKVELYNLPKSEKERHWHAFSMYDFSRYCDCLICVDFPAGFARHIRKKVIIEFENLKKSDDMIRAVDLAKQEASEVIAATCKSDKDLLQECLEVLL